MNPDDGNIYSDEMAKSLGLDPEDLIPLGTNEVQRLLKKRRFQAAKLERRKKNKKARTARRQNR